MGPSRGCNYEADARHCTYDACSTYAAHMQCELKSQITRSGDQRGLSYLPADVAPNVCCEAVKEELQYLMIRFAEILSVICMAPGTELARRHPNLSRYLLRPARLTRRYRSSIRLFWTITTPQTSLFTNQTGSELPTFLSRA